MDLSLPVVCEPEATSPRRRRLLLLIALSVMIHCLFLLTTRQQQVMVSNEPVMTLRFAPSPALPVAHPVVKPATPPTPPIRTVKPLPVIRRKPSATQIRRPRSVRRAGKRVVQTPARRQVVQRQVPPAVARAKRQPLRRAMAHDTLPSRGIEVVHQVKPRYPLLARRRGLQGRVVVKVQIDRSGQVRQVVVASSSGYRLLDQAAVKAVQRWRFRPALRQGVAVSTEMRIPVRFELKAVVDGDPLDD